MLRNHYRRRRKSFCTRQWLQNRKSTMINSSPGHSTSTSLRKAKTLVCFPFISCRSGFIDLHGAIISPELLSISIIHCMCLLTPLILSQGRRWNQDWTMFACNFGKTATIQIFSCLTSRMIVRVCCAPVYLLVLKMNVCLRALIGLSCNSVEASNN